MNPKESKRKDDVTVIAKNSGIAAMFRFVNLGLNYVSTFLITRILGADLFGVFVLGRTVVQMSGILSSLGLGPSLIRHIPTFSTNKERVNNIFQQGLKASFIFSSVVAACVFVFSYQIANDLFSEPRLETVLKVFFIGIPVLALIQILFGTLNGLKLITKRVLAENLILPFTNISILIAAYFLNLGLRGVIGAFIVSNLSALSFCFRITLQNSLWGTPFVTEEENKEDRKELRRFSVPLLFSTTLNFFQNWADTFMLGILSTTGAVGIYAISMRMAGFIQVPLTSFNMIFSPLIAEIYREGDTERLGFNYKLVTRVVLLLSIPIFCLLVLFPAELLAVFGKDFKNGWMAMVVICFGQLVNVSVGTSGQMLVMTGKPRINLINTGLFVVLTIILNFILIPKYDILGAGIANAVSFSILNAVRTVQIYRYVGIHPFSKGSLKPVFAGLVALGLSYMVKSGEMVNHEIFRVGLAASVFVIAYTSIIFLMRLSKEEKEMINLIKTKFVKKRN